MLFHLQSVRMVEKMNETMKTKLPATNSGSSWHGILSAVLIKFQCSPSSTTHLSLYELMIRRAMRLPYDAPPPKWKNWDLLQQMLFSYLLDKSIKEMGEYAKECQANADRFLEHTPAQLVIGNVI